METIAHAVDADEGVLGSAGGQQLHYRSWRPHGHERGVVVIIPGFNSHSGYYTWTGTRLASTGLATYAMDLRGRGKSDGERFYVEGFAEYVLDIAALIVRAKTANKPDVPVFLLGHSAGGVVACLYALSHPGELAGLICESFAFAIPAPDFALSLLKGLSYVAPHTHVLTLHNADFSRDPTVVAAMNADPLIAGESQPARTVAELIRADERLKTTFSAISVPLLILHGTADKAAKPDGSRFFFETAASKDKTLKLYEGVFHDPLNDLDKEKVLADIERWITERVPGQAVVEAM